MRRGRQATVRRWSPVDHSGEAVDDTGACFAFLGAAFDASGLRHLRPGQRVRLEWDGETITLVTIATMGS